MNIGRKRKMTVQHSELKWQFLLYPEVTQHSLLPPHKEAVLLSWTRDLKVQRVYSNKSATGMVKSRLDSLKVS